MAKRKRVAAVCWRWSPAGEPEFLLVRTSAGDRWTFPKGGLEPSDPSPSEGARREAREEAGVEGVMDSALPLGPYCHLACYEDGTAEEHMVEAWLMRVVAEGGPAEPGRAPAWFSPPAALRALSENQRAERYAAALREVIGQALSRIREMEPRFKIGNQKDEPDKENRRVGN